MVSRYRRHSHHPQLHHHQMRREGLSRSEGSWDCIRPCQAYLLVDKVRIPTQWRIRREMRITLHVIIWTRWVFVMLLVVFKIPYPFRIVFSFFDWIRLWRWLWKLDGRGGQWRWGWCGPRVQSTILNQKLQVSSAPTSTLHLVHVQLHHRMHRDQRYK